MKNGDMILLKVEYNSGVKGKYLIQVTEFHPNGLSGYFTCLNYKHDVNDQWPLGRWSYEDIVSYEVL